MFVVSVSKNKIKKSVLIGALVIVLSLCIVLILKGFKDSQYLNIGKEQSLSVATESDILAFISGCGWQVDEEAVEVRDVVIPESFDEVYSSYNQIQIAQGFNLEKYAGQRVKRWTYVIRNYPDTTPTDDFIRINILVSNGVIIGGDVCSVKLDGFMHGFYLPTDNE